MIKILKELWGLLEMLRNVEKEFGEKKIGKTFKSAVNSAYNKRLMQLDHDETC